MFLLLKIHAGMGRLCVGGMWCGHSKSFAAFHYLKSLIMICAVESVPSSAPPTHIHLQRCRCRPLWSCHVLPKILEFEVASFCCHLAGRSRNLQWPHFAIASECLSSAFARASAALLLFIPSHEHGRSQIPTTHLPNSNHPSPTPCSANCNQIQSTVSSSST